MKWENKTVHLLKINYMWWGWGGQGDFEMKINSLTIWLPLSARGWREGQWAK